MLAITFGWSFAALGLPAVPLASFAGSLGAVAIVYCAGARRHAGLSTNVLLLAGVTMNAFFSALILFVQYFADFAETYRTLRWLMGDLDVSSYQPLITALPLLALSFAVFAWLARPLNLLSLGSESAESTGIDVTRAQRAAFLSASLATGAAVSIGGPIGFVGIIVPHLVRLMVGSDHRVVLPASALFGAAFLVGCDVLARTVLSPDRAPRRRDHGAHRRAVLPVAAGEENLDEGGSSRRQKRLRPEGGRQRSRRCSRASRRVVAPASR